MKVVMLYRPKSEFAHGAEEYIREFERRTAREIESVDVDSPRGLNYMQIYQVMDHPTFLALSDDGALIQAWTGKPLPLINELSAYAAPKR